jgi:hypothetical protein
VLEHPPYSLDLAQCDFEGSNIFILWLVE